MDTFINILFFFASFAIFTMKPSEIQLLRDSPVKYKFIFDEAVAAGNINDVVTMLTEAEKNYIKDLKYNYPLATKLYRILMDDTTGEDFTNEAQYIPIDKIIYVAKELAVEGGNERFLQNLSQLIK